MQIDARRRLHFCLQTPAGNAFFFYVILCGPRDRARRVVARVHFVDVRAGGWVGDDGGRGGGGSGVVDKECRVDGKESSK